MKRANWIVGLFFMIGVVVSLAANGSVVHIVDSAQPLAQRWTQAFEAQNDLKKTCWIGYSIIVTMDVHSHIGNGYCHSNNPTIAELLSGQVDKRETSVQEAPREALEDNRTEYGWKAEWPLGILFQFDKNANRIQDFTEIHISDFDSPVDLEGCPLIWMGQADPSVSLDFLINLYEKDSSADHKEDIIVAIALHREEKEVVPFLKKIVQSREGQDIRKQAVFWLSQQDADVLDFLVDIAHTDRSEDVREHAVFAISLVDGKAAEEALISLAKKDRDPEIRKKAIFWLGQKASEKAAGFMKEVVENDPDTDVKEHAVFSLSQMQSEESARLLMEIAKTNPNLEVRKKAIFWLGQSGDPESVDFLVDLVRQID